MTIALLTACVATGVAAVFCAQLARQYAARRRDHALAWAISMGLFAAASAAVAVGIVVGWSVPTFGVYWIAGALLTVPFLAAGQLLLMDPRRSVLWWTLAGLSSIWAVAAVSLSSYDTAVLAEAGGAIPLGREVFASGFAYTLLRPFNYLFLIVVGGSIWSAVQTRRWGLLLIALGVTVAAAASSMAGHPARTQYFPVLLAAGVSLMYGGFRAAGRPPKPSSRAARRAESAAA
jgi:hypothetical protein